MYAIDLYAPMAYICRMSNKQITIVELAEFIAFSDKHLSSDERMDIITHLSFNPTDGDLIQGTGGLRKLRWAAKGKRKSGGVRIFHYYHSDDIPLFLITGFAKSEMENISRAAKNEYRKLLPLIVQSYKELRNG